VRGSYADLRRQLDLLTTIRMEPLLPEDVDEARALAGLQDPFDRMIAGTALRLGLPLLTRDEAMTKSSSVRTWW
jgi:PIN domain nuclease of toxin-antitoxin system